MKPAHSMSWNERLRLERIQRNLRQHDLAEQLGTSVVTIQRWERGRHLPSAYFRVKLCALFGKSPQELGFVPIELSSSRDSGIKNDAPEAIASTEPSHETFPAAASLASSHIYDPAIPSSLLKEDALVPCRSAGSLWATRGGENRTRHCVGP